MADQRRRSLDIEQQGGLDAAHKAEEAEEEQEGEQQVPQQVVQPPAQPDRSQQWSETAFTSTQVGSAIVIIRNVNLLLYHGCK